MRDKSMHYCLAVAIKAQCFKKKLLQKRGYKILKKMPKNQSLADEKCFFFRIVMEKFYDRNENDLTS